MSDGTTENTGRRAFILIILILGITQLGFYLTAAALPLYLRDLGAAQSRIGFEVGLGSLSGIFLAFVLGPGINRFGTQRFLIAGAALYLIAAAGMLFFRFEAAVAAMRTLQGIGSAVIIPSALTLTPRLVPHRPGTAMGIVGTVSALALAIGPPTGLILYTAGGPAGLLLPAAGAAAIGLTGILFLPNLPAAAAGARGFGFDRRWLRFLAISVLFNTYFGGIVAYLPITLTHAHGPNAGIFFTADALGVLALRIPTGMLIDRIGSFLPKILGILIAVPGIACLALPPSPLTLIASGATSGIGAGMLVTAVLLDLTRLSTEENRGTAMALSTAGLTGAIFAGSTAAGFLIGRGGFNAILLFGGVTCLAALPFSLYRTVGLDTAP